MNSRAIRSAAYAAGFAVGTCASAQVTTVQELGLLPGDRAVAAAVNAQADNAISPGGDQFLSVWTDYRGRSSGSQSIQGDGDIMGLRLDAQGNPVDAVPFLIAGGMGLQNRPLVAWNGENWLVMYRSQDPVGGYFATQIRGVRVSPQGAVLDATPLVLTGSTFDPNDIGLNLSGGNGQWLATRCIYHNDGYGTFLAGQRISGAGQLLDATPVMLNDWVYGACRTIAMGTDYLVVGPDWSTNQLKGRRVGANAQPIGASFNLPATAVNLAGNGAEFYVTWISGFTDLVGSRMSWTGTLSTPAGTLLFPSFAGDLSMMHDGTNWWLSRSVSNQAWTMRVNPAGTVLDPGGDLLPITVTGTVSNLYSPQIVPRRSGGGLFTWNDSRETMGNDSNVFSMPFGPEGAPGIETALSIGSTNQRNAAVCRGPGSTTAVAYISEVAAEDRVLVHMVDASGAALGAEPIEVFAGPTVGRVGIAYNGSVFLVTFDVGASGLTTTQIKARRMSPDGSFIDADAFDVMPGFNPAVEALGDDFLVAGAKFGTTPQIINLHAARIDGPTGSLLDGATGMLLAGGYVSGEPRVRADGGRWLICAHSQWTHDSSQGDAILAMVSAAGVPTPAFNPTPFSGGTGDLDIAYSESKYLLVWRSNSLANANNYVSGRIMNTDGTYATGAFTIAEAAGRQLRPTVAWDGSAFLVAWDDQRNQDSFFDNRTDVYAVRVSESGEVLDASAFPLEPGTDAECTPALLSRGDGAVLIATTRLTFTPELDTYRIGLSRLGTAPDCIADFDGSGVVSVQDIFDFLSAYFSGNLAADVNHVDGVTVQDIFDFLGAYFAGC